MGLLNESKRMWLLSYIFFAGIIGILYYYQWYSSIGKTVGYILATMQLIMLVEFLLIILFKWTSGCRIIASIVFLSLIIYEGVNDYLTKRYIIIPIFIITEFQQNKGIRVLKNGKTVEFSPEVSQQICTEMISMGT